MVSRTTFPCCKIQEIEIGESTCVTMFTFTEYGFMAYHCMKSVVWSNYLAISYPVFRGSLIKEALL